MLFADDLVPKTTAYFILSRQSGCSLCCKCHYIIEDTSK